MIINSKTQKTFESLSEKSLAPSSGKIWQSDLYRFICALLSIDNSTQPVGDWSVGGESMAEVTVKNLVASHNYLDSNFSLKKRYH